MPSNRCSAINKLCKHHFDECSDLPRLSCIGIFSCSACDNWRERIHSKGFGKKLPRRDFLSDWHQCRRPKLDMGPIKIRVICNEGSPPVRNGMAPRMLMIDEENTPLNNAKCITRDEVGKRKRAKAVLSGLKKAKEAKQVEAQLILNRQHEIVEEEIQLKKEMLAVASRNLEDLTQKVQTCSSELIEVEKKLKSKKVLMRYYDKNDSSVPVLDDVAYLCEAIERACHHLKESTHQRKQSY